jgi:hypothetical protein
MGKKGKKHKAQKKRPRKPGYLEMGDDGHCR